MRGLNRAVVHKNGTQSVKPARQQERQSAWELSSLGGARLFAGCALALTLSSLAHSMPPAREPGVQAGREGKAPSKARVELPGSRSPGVSHADLVIIPMKGTFGAIDDGDEWIDPRAFAALLKQAKTLNPKFIVLDIESPGGRVSVMNLVAEAIMKELPAGSGPQVVAWPGEAASAASFVTLTCPRIIVKPTARIGAALTVVQTPKGMVAVEDLPTDSDAYSAKIRSFDEAFERSAMQYGGHPIEVRKAMALKAAELYWSPSVRRFVAALPDPKRPGDFEAIDSKDTVLTLTAQEALKYGIAAAQAHDEDSLKSALGMAAGATTVRLGQELPRWFARVRGELGKLSEARDSEMIATLLHVYTVNLAAAIKADGDLASASKALKTAGGGPRAGDGPSAQIADATRRKTRARDAAGRAVVRLRELESVSDSCIAELRALEAEVDIVPIAVSEVPPLRHSFQQYENGNLPGAQAALNTLAKKPPKQ